jgi:hypothetical protein
VVGKEVRFQQTTFEAYKNRFVGSACPGAMAQGMTDMAAAKKRGPRQRRPADAGNTTPTSFRQWCEEVLKPAVIDQTQTVSVC